MVSECKQPFADHTVAIGAVFKVDKLGAEAGRCCTESYRCKVLLGSIRITKERDVGSILRVERTVVSVTDIESRLRFTIVNVICEETLVNNLAHVNHPWSVEGGLRV